MKNHHQQPAQLVQYGGYHLGTTCENEHGGIDPTILLDQEVILLIAGLWGDG